MKEKTEKIELIKQMIEEAEVSLTQAKQMMAELTGVRSGNRANLMRSATANGRIGEEGTVIEGVFDGVSMIGPDGKEYQVPANYASKSKLIPGDHLKLTIQEDGAFIYKQIGPVERVHMVGTLANDSGNFTVIAGGKVFKVLYASVSYFKAQAGELVTIIIPKDQPSEWAAIENVVPDALSESEIDKINANSESQLITNA